MTNEIAVPFHKDSVIKTASAADRRGYPIPFLPFHLSLRLHIHPDSDRYYGVRVFRGISQINWEFLSTVPSTIKGTFGILGNIVNTFYIVVITLLIATPLGVGAAIYLNEYAKGGRAVRLIEFTTETLSGIPSIIFGLFGYVFFGDNAGFRLFHFNRCTDTLHHGPAAYHQNHPGSA